MTNNKPNAVFKNSSGTNLTAMKLCEHTVAELITVALAATQGRTRYPRLPSFHIHEPYVCGVVNDIPFFAFETGQHRVVVIKEESKIEQDEITVFSCKSYLDFGFKEMRLHGEEFEKAENIFSRLPI